MKPFCNDIFFTFHKLIDMLTIQSSLWIGIISIMNICEVYYACIVFNEIAFCKNTEMLYNITPAWQWILDILITDKKEIWSNRDGDRKKNAEITIDATCDQWKILKKNGNKKIHIYLKSENNSWNCQNTRWGKRA